VGAGGITLLCDRKAASAAPKLVAETFQLDERGLVRRAFVAHAGPSTLA
jgi:hypothetical protein